MIAIKKYYFLLLAMFACMGCEKLEDTYSDFAGDGEIRYLGQCEDVTLKLGWKKLLLQWTNSVDPLIAHIKVTWKLEEEKEEVLLDPNTTEYTIDGLTDGTYEVTVCGVDNEGNESLAATLYGRPYTESHEMVQNIPQLVTKHFFVGNRLALFFSNWSESIRNARLTYTKADGTPGNLELTSDWINQHPYYLLSDEIKEGTPVFLKRKGVLGEDEIELADVELERNAVFSNDFKTLFRARFGTEEPTADQLASIEELDIDYSLNSLEDILYLPYLKRLNLGKNRYLNAAYLSANQSASVLLEDKERSLFALQVANEILHTEVYQYNRHFLPDTTLPYMHQEGNPVPAEHTFLSAEHFDLTATPQDEADFDSHLEWLSDGNLLTCWEPIQSDSWREHEIVAALDNPSILQGVRIIQKSFGQYNSADKAFAPSVVKIQVSSDGIDWNNATYLDEITIGNTGGEITDVYFTTRKNVNFIRFVIGDLVYGNNFDVQLAEIKLF